MLYKYYFLDGTVFIVAGMSSVELKRAVEKHGKLLCREPYTERGL